MFYFFIRSPHQDIEAQLQAESDEARDTITSLEESVAEEKRRREEAEQDILKHKRVGGAYLLTFTGRVSLIFKNYLHVFFSLPYWLCKVSSTKSKKQFVIELFYRSPL